MSKIIVYDKEAREKLVRGVDKVVDTVKVTVGPRGRNVILGKPFGGVPQIVNDGVTIAKEIDLKDPLESAGAQLLKEVSSKTNDSAGDGTTTASILAQSIIHEGLKKLDEGYNPIQMKDGILKATQTVVDFIKSKATEVDDTTLQQVATVSAGNNEEIGKLIAEAIEKVGKDGIVTVDEGTSTGITVKSAEGMVLDKGYLSPYFVTDPERMEAVLDQPYILCVDKKINLVSDLVPILNTVAKNQQSLLLVAEDVEGEALAAIVVNVMRKVLRAVAVKAPGFGDSRKAILKDLCALTGGQLWSDELGIPLDTVDPNEFFGRATKVKVNNEETTIVVDKPNEKLSEHIASLRALLSTETNDYNKEKLQERIARLTGGVAVIKVGAPTEVELKEKKLRIEDALNATRAAQEEGIVAGGGYTLLEAQEKCKRTWDSEKNKADYDIGYDILIDALSLPAKQIAENAGVSGDIIIAESKEKKLGYNALTNSFEDLLKTGVIDPAKVTRCALENAASIASIMLTTQAAVVDEPPKEDNSNDPTSAFKPAGSTMMM